MHSYLEECNKILHLVTHIMQINEASCEVKYLLMVVISGRYSSIIYYFVDNQGISKN